MLKACPICGKVHQFGKRCFVGKATSDKETKLRKTRAWKRKSEQIREDADYLCEVCKAEGRYTYEGLEVHHIIKLRDYPEGFLDDSNLVCLCEKCHKLAEAGKIPVERLRLLACIRNGEVPPYP